MKKQFFLGALLCLYASMPAWTQNKAFIQNVGQITDPQLQTRTDIDFKVSEQKGLQVFIGKGKLHYQWLDAESTSDSTTIYHSYRLDMELVGSNKNPRLSYGAPQQAYERYFLSWVNMDNSNEGKVAHRYNSVTYHDVYPHIDWKLYFTPEGQLEYDFIVHPGGKVSDIKLVYQGADSLSLDPKGRLNIYTPKGQLIESAPYSYEEKSKKQIASAFKVMGNKVSFNNAAYNGTLVIDPIIEWGTYFGGIAADAGNGLAVGSNGIIYMVGTTSSINNIATNGSHQQTFGGGSALYGADGIISKWNSAGGLLWATYYGGTGIDNISSVVIDNNNNVIVGGFTNSNDGIATANMHKSVKGNNAYDVFLAKFDSMGVRYKATYHGGMANEGNTSFGMTMDRAGNILMVGNTNSIDYPVDANAYRTIMEASEGFLVKFNNELEYRWNTLVGGNAADNPTCVYSDEESNIYIAGYTRSNTGIAYGNMAQANYNGVDDGFINKFDSTGQLQWGTYLGGVLLDRLTTITCIDSFIFVGGYTANNNLATANAAQTMNAGGNDGIVACYSNSGNKVWITYVGGTVEDYITCIEKANNNNIYVGLRTHSENGITSGQAIQDTLSGNQDIGIVKFDILGNKLWGTYLGGSLTDEIKSIYIENEYLLLAGYTESPTNIAHGSVYQNFYNGARDAFIIKINLCDAPIITNNITGPDTLCPHTTVLYSIPNIPDANSYHWLLPSGWHGQSDSNSIAVMVHGQSGTVSVYTQSACGGFSDTVHFAVHVYPNRNITIQQQNNILRTTQVFPSYQWMMNGSPIAGATNSTYIPTSNGAYSLKVIDDNGCVFVSDTIDMNHLSIKETNRKWLFVYPNPTDGQIELDLPAAGTLQVVDLLGRALQLQTVTAGKQSIELSNLPTGTYTLLYTTADGQYSGLVVKE